MVGCEAEADIRTDQAYDKLVCGINMSCTEMWRPTPCTMISAVIPGEARRFREPSCMVSQCTHALEMSRQ